uniref:Transcription repressor n=1 Tax=Wolffia arrhiza TaxID=161111 RepID=D2XQY1_WOLAR|nr:hypothetical protein [Wolffia arrhiza]
MERGQVKQKLWRVFKISSFLFTCSSNVRREDDVLEPLQLRRRCTAEQIESRLSPEPHPFAQRREKAIPPRLKKIKLNKQRTFSSDIYAFSSSSSDYSLFSSEEMAIRSGNISSDSSLYYFTPCSRGSRMRRKAKEYQRAEEGCRRGVQNPSSLQRCSPRTRGFAVEKHSKDPEADFRSSMMEMIMERQIFQAHDLKDLLENYLSLNDPRHHPIIVRVFSDVWTEVFGC